MAKAAANAWVPAPPAQGAATSAPPQVLALGDGHVAWAQSPARVLHARLAATFVAPPLPAPVPVDDSLSPRAKLGIMLGSTGLLWAIVIAAVAAVR